jgi:hypothetical protein
MKQDIRERPILFSGPMIKAILSGAKTQTRRIVKEREESAFLEERGNDATFAWYGCKKRDVFGCCGSLHFSNDRGFAGFKDMRCRYGMMGDRLWVRETWAWSGERPEQLPGDPVYRADGPGPWEWRPSIHLPRWASRITLEITGIRAQRLQDISELDCEAELGVPPHSLRNDAYPQFRTLWDSINSKREGCSWESNPWTWRISFKRIEDEATA